MCGILGVSEGWYMWTFEDTLSMRQRVYELAKNSEHKFINISEQPFLNPSL